MSGAVEISVITATFNGRSRIGLLLDALSRQTFRNFELIIISDGSSDDTVPFIETYRSQFPQFTVIANKENKGRPACLVQAAAAANGKLLVFFDDDMIPDEHCVAAHFERSKASNWNAIFIGNGYRNRNGISTSFHEFLIDNERQWKLKHPSKFRVSEKEFATTTCNLSIPKQIFQGLNGFDPSIRELEDVELTVRALNSGIEVYYDNSIVAWHNDFPDLRKYIKRLNEYNSAKKNIVTSHAHVAEFYKRRNIDWRRRNPMRWLLFPFRTNFFVDLDHKLKKPGRTSLGKRFCAFLFRLTISANLHEN